MSDNLTKQFKAELQSRGITASDTEVNRFISQQPNLFQSIGQPMTPPVTGGRDISWLETPETKSSMFDAVGAFAWRGLDAALLGIPGIALGEKEPYQWDTLGPGAKTGAVFGEALGFLVPLGGISKLGRAGVSAIKGTGKITRQAAKEAGSMANAAGLEGQLAKKTVKKTLSNPVVKKMVLPLYSSGVDDIAKAERTIRDGIFGELAREFPDAAASQLDDITEAALRGMRTDGVHVNNIGHWVEKALNTTFNVADKSKITRYSGRFAELSANFGVYNLLASGIQSLAGRQDFDPVSDVGHAFMFSSLLPAVEMVGGGGKVRVIREANRLRKMMGKFDRKIIGEYDNMSVDELNGLIKIMTRDNFLKDTLMGKEALGALRRTGGKDLARDDALQVMKSIAGRIDAKNLWRDFRSYAGEDFVQSLGRMALVGFYFNAQTLLDYNMLKNMDPEILGAHLITGAMFGKIKKPLFQDPHPTLNGFQERRLALEYFGMDASNIEAIARNFTLNEHQGVAYTGIRGNATIQKIANIINSESNVKQSDTLKEKPARIDSRDNFLKWTFGLYDLYEVSGRVQDANPKVPVNLKNLTRRQLNQIKSELEKIDIGDGQTLNSNNFHSFRDKLMEQTLQSQYQEYMDMTLSNARELGIQVDALETDALDMNSPVSVGRIRGLERFIDKPGYEWVVKWQQIRDVLEGAGFIREIKQLEPLRAENVDISKAKNIKTSMEQMVETLRIENYGESTNVHIEPSDNGFLDALRTYKVTKNLSSAYNIVEGVNMTERETALRELLETEIGSKVPKRLFNLLGTVKLGKPEGMKQAEWDRINAEGEYSDTHQKLINILKIWGANKTDGTIKNRDKKETNTIKYDTALSIVSQFEKQGFIVTDSMAEQMNRYYWNRFLETADVDVRHQVILDHFVAHNIGKFETRANGRKVLVVPDRESVMSQIEREIGTREGPEFEQAMMEYDAVMNRVATIRGKFLEVRRKMHIEDTGEASMVSAIKDAYTATEGFTRDVLEHFRNVEYLTQDHGVWINRVKSLLESRKIKTEEGEESVIQFENAREAKEFIAELDNLISSGVADIKLIGTDSINLLKNLRSKIVMEEGAIKELGAEYESSAKLIERMIESEMDNNFQLKSNIEAIIFGMDSYASDRIQGRRRLERLLAGFNKDLKKVNISLEEGTDLSTIAEIYADNPNRKINDFIDRMAISLRAWRKGFNEETWIETQKEFAQEFSDVSGTNIDHTPRYSSSYISQQYGRYNSVLEGNEWLNTQEVLRESRDFMDKSMVDTQISGVVDNVRSAIRRKHTRGEEVNESAADAEFTTFMRHVFPSFLANSIGTKKVLSGSLDFDSKGRPVILLKETATGEGQVSMFISDMANSKIRVLKLDTTGIFNGRKQDITNIKTLDEIINQASIVPGESALRQQIRREERGQELNETQEPFQKTVQVITSVNNRILVSLDNLRELAPSGRGILNERFKVWYDAKSEILRNDPVALEHLKSLFGEYVEKGAVTSTPEGVRQLIRAMYWDGVSSSSFTELIKAANNSAELGTIGSSFFKYVQLAEATGAKTRGSRRLIEDLEPYRDYFSPEQIVAMDYYLAKDGLDVVALGDEATKAFSTERLTKELLREKLKGRDPNTQSYKAIQNQIKKLGDLLPSLLNRSGVDAHSWLGTNATNVLYLHRGRVLGGRDGNGKTAGVKPTGWFNDPSGTILLKTNFTYDPKIAELLDNLGIDILTTGSAAKAFNAEQVNINAGDVKGARSVKEILDMSGKFVDRTQLDANNHVTRMRLEDLFIGKTEDRHGLTNITYALSDFLPEFGYDAHMQDYVGYNKRIKSAMGPFKALATGTNRNAAAEFLINSLRQEGALFEDSTTGIVSLFLAAGGDPNSTMARDVIQRVANRHMVNTLRNPKTEGASYSVLIPFIEGTPSVYDGSKRIINGGKKLSYEDGNINIRDWNNVSYIVSFNTKNVGKRDLQLFRDKNGRWSVNDPYGKVKISDSKLKKELSRIEKIEKKLRDNRTITYKDLFTVLDTSNKRRRKEDTRIYLHSLTLRMPNLGGDVAVHRVEGFYDTLMSNVTGINITDLAATHQGDFDADMGFNYPFAPGKFASAVFKMSGASKDAYVYESSGPVVDIFNNGGGIRKAGSAGDVGDTMSEHTQKIGQSKANFGSIKRLASGISAIDRMKVNINAFNTPIETLTIGNNTQFNGFLQRYKNVLQSIIDALKKPNFVSEAEKVDDVMKFILFDRPFKGSEVVTEQLKKYGELDYEPFFKISEKVKGSEREVLMDTILESVNALGRSTKFLSDVWDESGRRPPEPNEIANMKSDLNRFLGDPNKQIFINLLNKYNKAGETDKKMPLIKLFYGDQPQFRDIKALTESIYKKNLRTPSITKEVIFFQEKSTDKNPGNYIVSRINQSATALFGYSTIYNKQASEYLTRITNLLDDVQMIGAITNRKTFEDFTNFLEEGSISEGLQGRFRANEIIDGSLARASNIKNIQNYSILSHILENQRNSLARFIRNSGKSSPNAVARAQSRLNTVDAVMEYFKRREDQSLSEIIGFEKDGKRHQFYFTDLDFTGKNYIKSRSRVHENTTNDIHYIYEIVTGKDGVTRFKEAGWAAKGRKKYLQQKKYVVLKNPVKWNLLTNREIADGHALFRTTGDILAENIHMMPGNDNIINRFMIESDGLKQDIGSLARDIYKVSKKSPHQRENWLWEQKEEDAMVSKFMNTWLRRKNTNQEPSEIMSEIDSNQRVMDIASYLMKPTVIHGNVAVAKVADNPIPLPAFKINKRMSMAMLRWLRANGYDDVFKAIVSDYGRHYRQIVDRVIPTEMSELTTSKLYHKGGLSADRSPIVDLVFEKGLLYQPNIVGSMAHITRNEMKKFANKSRVERDAENNLIISNQYGNLENFRQMIKVYKDPKEYTSKDKDCI